VKYRCESVEWNQSLVDSIAGVSQDTKVLLHNYLTDPVIETDWFLLNL
jgi:hypothetical protein